MENETVHKLPIFFILGRPRSGTTLLRTLFDAHPAVKIPVEYPIIFDIYNRFKHVKRWDEKKVDQLYRVITGRRIYDFWKFGNLKISPEEFRSRLPGVVQEHGLPAVFRMLHYLSWSAFEKRDILALGDKNPVYSLFLEELASVFPDAKFICLVRDPRDTFVSMRNFEFEAPNAAIQAWRWNYIMNLFLKAKDRLPRQVIIVRYEDLVTNTEAEFRRLCSFLNIPYSPEALHYLDKKDQILDQYTPGLIERYQKSLLEPISGKKIGSWKEMLSQKETAIIEHISKSCMHYFGYSLSGSAVSLPTRIVCRIWGGYAALLYFFMRSGNRLPWRVTQSAASLLPLLRRSYMLFSRSNK